MNFLVPCSFIYKTSPRQPCGKINSELSCIIRLGARAKTRPRGSWTEMGMGWGALICPHLRGQDSFWDGREVFAWQLVGDLGSSLLSSRTLGSCSLVCVS